MFWENYSHVTTQVSKEKDIVFAPNHNTKIIFDFCTDLKTAVGSMFRKKKKISSGVASKGQSKICDVEFGR